MNSKTWTRIIAMTLLAALAMPVSVAAQDKGKPDHPHQYHHYQLIDAGTFGGPQSYQYVFQFTGGVINNRGTTVGWADTTTQDPYCLDFPDCYAFHAFQWQDGVTTDLGVLPGGLTSEVNWISANGLMAGVADNGQVDPLSGGTLPQFHGVLWDHGVMTDMGTLPEGGYISYPGSVNSRGEVVGNAQNTVPDPYPMFVADGTQTRAFYWKNGVMQDIGTLYGGTDAQAGVINEHGQVTGWSYINSIPSVICAPGSPLTTGSFIWDKQSGMKDLGGLGGTCTLAQDINNRGQVIGGSALTGDSQIHPFVWDASTGITDLLGSSDGNYGYAEGENDRGEVVGGSCGSVICHAVLWRKRGGQWHRTDLSTVTESAFSISINSSEQVIGNFAVTTTQDAFLWEDGGPLVDLNTLVPSGSGLQLYESHQINDRGEITIGALDASGNNRAVLLIPCDENHPGVEGCDYSLVDAAAMAQSATASYHPSGAQRPSHSRRSNRYHMPGLQSPSK